VDDYQPDLLLGQVEGAEVINLSKARQNGSVGYDPGFYRERDNLRQSCGGSAPMNKQGNLCHPVNICKHRRAQCVLT